MDGNSFRKSIINFCRQSMKLGALTRQRAIQGLINAIPNYHPLVKLLCAFAFCGVNSLFIQLTIMTCKWPTST